MRGDSDVPGALCSVSVTVADAQLGALLGDAMPAIALGADSPALAIASDCPATDQLGRPRDAQICDADAIDVPEPGALARPVAAWIALTAVRLARREIRGVARARATPECVQVAYGAGERSVSESAVNRSSGSACSVAWEVSKA